MPARWVLTWPLFWLSCARPLFLWRVVTTQFLTLSLLLSCFSAEFYVRDLLFYFKTGFHDAAQSEPKLLTGSHLSTALNLSQVPSPHKAKTWENLAVRRDAAYTHLGII